MAKSKEEKTNVMWTLEQKGISYTAHTYPPDGPIDGVSVAGYMGQDVEQVFKTLVTKAASGNYYVFDIPVAESLDLKKAAKAVGEKSIAMIAPAALPQRAERSRFGVRQTARKAMANGARPWIMPKVVKNPPAA